MKRILVYLFFFLFFSNLGFASNSTHPIIKELILNLKEGKFQEIEDLMTPQFKKRMTKDNLQEGWQSNQKAFGSLKGSGKTLIKENGLYKNFNTPLTYEKGILILKVTLTPENKITGLSFERASGKNLSYTIEESDSFKEKELVFDSEGVKLSGFLCLPKKSGPFPTVLLVQDLGPLDRNSSTGKCKPFLDLAHQLAEYGIASFRYDKRNFYSRTKAVQTADEEIVYDAINALKMLKDESDINKDQIFLIGHGLGGMMIPRIHEGFPDIKGAVFMSPNIRPLQDMVLTQVLYLCNLDNERSEIENQRLEEIIAQKELIQSLDASSDPNETILLFPNSYWLNFQGYDAAAKARDMDIPLFFAHGGRDYQVTYNDWKIWKYQMDNNEDAVFIDYPNLNHLFVTGYGPSHPHEYTKKGKVSKTFVKDIVLWIMKQNGIIQFL